MKKREAVSALAARYYGRLLERSGGSLPPATSERGWQGLATAMRITAGPLPSPCPAIFKARLFFHKAYEQWFIVYTPNAPVQQRCEMICHELVEYMTHQDYGPVIDRAPRYSFAYDGGLRPYDIRHQISLAVTRMCFDDYVAAAKRSSDTTSTGYPAVDALLTTGQLTLGMQVPASHPFPKSRRPRPEVAQWPHRSGKCRCGCQGALHDLMDG